MRLTIDMTRPEPCFSNRAVGSARRMAGVPRLGRAAGRGAWLVLAWVVRSLIVGGRKGR